MNIQETQLNTPFIRKLNHILNDSIYQNIITWDQTGTMIDILDQKKIQTQILPKFFRHSKFQSFIRQLNLYGFKKIKKTDSHRFRHPDLVKGISLFSIKSQRKFKNFINRKKHIEQQSHSNIQEVLESNGFQQKQEKNQISQTDKNQKVQTEYLRDNNSMNLFFNPLDFQQNCINYTTFNGMSIFHPPYIQSISNNSNGYGFQNQYFQNLNNIFFYN